MTRNFFSLLIATILMIAAATPRAEDTQQIFGSWTLRCSAEAGAAKQDCMMFQNLVLKTGGQPVLQFGIGIAPPDNLPTVLVSLPLGIALPPGITIQIDAATPATFPVERCEPDGCRAGMKLRQVTVNQLGHGHQLHITFYDGSRKPIKVPLSLDGFGAAFAALTAAQR